MRNLLTLLFVVTLAFICIQAQDKADGPAVPESIQIKLLKAQHALDEQNASLAQMDNTFKNLQLQYPKTQALAQQAAESLQQEIDAAFKAAKLDKKDYDLDFQAMKFTKKPAQPSAAPQTKATEPSEKK